MSFSELRSFVQQAIERTKGEFEVRCVYSFHGLLTSRFGQFSGFCLLQDFPYPSPAGMVGRLVVVAEWGLLTVREVIS